MDVFTSTIDDKLVDEETRTSVSDNPKDGIIPIDVPSKGEDMPPLPPQPLPPQPLLESKDEVSGFKLCISLYGDFSNNRTNQQTEL